MASEPVHAVLQERPRLHRVQVFCCVLQRSLPAAATPAAAAGIGARTSCVGGAGGEWLNARGGGRGGLVGACIDDRLQPAELSPGADVGGVSPVPVQMWEG